MKVVVIGGTGNISISIVKQLLENGHDVTCFNRGKRQGLNKDARHITGDRKDRAVFEKTMRMENFDAAIDMISYNADDAASSIAAFRGVKHFIQCSTVATYGVDFNWMPVTEDHPCNPITAYGKGKVAADKLLLDAYYREGFPVTIIKPSTTYGPILGMPRQLEIEFSWLDRIRRSKPVIVCGDGKAIHQFLHVDDAAKGFAGVLGRNYCVGQTYNLVNRGYISWEMYHKTAMKVLGVDVDLIGIPLKTLLDFDISRFGICRDIYAYNLYYSSEKIFRDIPEFKPSISLEEGMVNVIGYLDREGRIPDSGSQNWEDRLIEAQQSVAAIASNK